MDDLRLLSAVELARRIRSGEVSSRQVVDTHIDQLRWVNPSLNALVRDRYLHARAEADEADRVLAEKGPDGVPPLHGVPCTIKECFALTGMPNSSGLVSRRHVLAQEDAVTVARLRKAGAIPLGVTNVSELCMWMETNNFVYGRTKNPYDLRRTVGGSSGGEGAVVGAAGSPFGLGSDVGGSIRGPAFFNGIFGHKPSGGLIPNSGQFPSSENEAKRYLCSGPMCRRAEDLWPLVKILAGPDGQDDCVELELGDPASVSLRGRTLLNVEDNGIAPVDGDLRDAQRKVVHHLEAQGMQVRHVRFEALRKSFDIWSAMMGIAADTPFGKMMGNGRRFSPVWELMKWGVGRSNHTFMGTMLALADRVPRLIPKEAQRMARLGLQLKDELTATLGDDGVMLYPSNFEVAPKHSAPIRQMVQLKWPFQYLGIINILQLPATQVPLGLNDQGLPLGLQVISNHGNDHVTVAIAEELERRFGGWVPPSLAGLPSSP